MNSEERAIQRTIWREQERDEIENLKTRLAVKHGLARDAKFEMAWKIAANIASNYTESSQRYEVEQFFDELAELLK